jgi:3-oxoadipate enol-lactonase
MSFVAIDKTRLYYRLEGTPGRPVLVLSTSLGCDHGMWAPQMPRLLEHFQVLRYDTRGHGASDVPKAEYSIEMLGRDVVGLVDALKISRFAYCGLSLGGMIGQWLAINAGDRLTGLVLANTSPLMAPKSNWDERRRTVFEGGMASIVDAVMGRFFLPETWANGDPNANSVRAVFLAMDPAGYNGCVSAIRDMDHTPSLGKIRVPTLVIASDRDVSTPWAGHGEILARTIPGAKAIHLPTAHISNIEQPEAFTAAVCNHLRPSSR